MITLGVHQISVILDVSTIFVIAPKETNKILQLKYRANFMYSVGIMCGDYLEISLFNVRSLAGRKNA